MLRYKNTLYAVAAVTTGLLFCSSAFSQSCTTTSYPYPLQNGSVADANQVTADLNCAPIYGLATYSGNVGIGTTSPASKFEVYGATWLNRASGDVGIRAQGLTVSFAPAGNYSNGVDPGDGFRNTSFISATSATAPVIITLRNVAANPFWDIVMDPNQSSALLFSRAGYAPTLTLSGGNVGIGTTSPTATLHVNGSVILTQGYSTASDARLKRDVRPVTGAIETVERLQGVRYAWRPVAERTVGKDLILAVDEPQVGFLAQDLEKVIPEAVVAPKPGSEAVYTVKDEKIIPFLVEAIKEQQQEIVALRARLVKLEAKEK